MTQLLHQLIQNTAQTHPKRVALKHKSETLSYRELWQQVCELANAFIGLGLEKHDRVAVYLPKQFATVISFFACSKAGLIFVPVNPLLKSSQLAHIIKDSGARLLITSVGRYRAVAEALDNCQSLGQLLFVDNIPDTLDGYGVYHWDELARQPLTHHRCIDRDPVAIFYTSGSTGLAKGVLLSHGNMVSGAYSVSEYLQNNADDKLLAVLPLSFDYGFSQLTTAFRVGASVVLMDYLLPADVIKLLQQEHITGLAGVPSLWVQLARLELIGNARQHLRYITNSGGRMPANILQRLRKALPETDVYLMYGLTEAFRSSYLPPALLDQHPDSIGIAIPNAELSVLREDGSECAIDETGELVHRGSLVALGYWNDPARSEQRFRELTPSLPGMPFSERAVWSGDSVRRDRNGLLYFVGRRDDMIKTAGYRVSPDEIEDMLQNRFPAHDFAAFSLPHPELGEAIVIATTHPDNNIDKDIENACKLELPGYMQPQRIVHIEKLPLNSNNKVDRPALRRSYAENEQS